MRRLGGFFCAIVLVLAAVLSSTVPAAASAERDRLSAQVQVSKSSLPGPGTVDLKLTITNKGNPVTNVTITYPESGQTVSLGDLGTDQTAVHEDPRWEITQSMLDTPLTFEVSWTSQDGSTRSGTTPAVTIAEASANVNVRAEATVDKTHVAEGDKVMFTFTFENTGNVRITDAYLEAPPLNGGERLGDDFSVEPGQSNTKTWSPTVNEEITVNPTYTYTVDGQQHTLSCDPIAVRIGEGGEEEPVAAALSISATPNQTTVGPGGQVEFSIAVQNIGGTEISNVRVVCSNGVAAQLAQNSLMPGASTTATQNVRIDATQNVTYTVSGTSEGQPLSVDSEPVQITVDQSMAVPSATPMDASNIVQIDVSVVTQVSKPGPVPVEVTVRNLSEQALKNIVVTAETVSGTAAADSEAGGAASPMLETTASAADAPSTVTLGTIPSLAARQNENITGTLDIQQTAGYIFRVEAELPDQTVVTSETSRALITLESQSTGLENWQWIAIIMAAVIAAVVIILVVYMRRRRSGKNEQKEQQAAGGPTQAARPPQRPQQQKPQRPPQVTPTAPRASDTADFADRHPTRVAQTTAPRSAPAASAAQGQRKVAAPAPRKLAKTRPQASSMQQPTQQFGDRNNF